MKTFITILCSMFLLVEAGVCAPSIGNYTCHLQTKQGTFTWDISSDRLYATPGWDSDTNAIPLSLDSACQLGRGWLGKHDFHRFHVEHIGLECFPDPISVWMQGDKVKKRFFYQIEYRSEHDSYDIMYVFVLLDGTVVEPTLTPLPAKKQ